MKPWKYSLTTQLLTLILSCFLGLTLLISGLIYWRIQHHFNENINHFLNNEMQVLTGILKRTDYNQPLEQEVIWEPQSNRHLFWVRVFDKNNQLVKETPGFANRFNLIDWPKSSTIEKAVINNHNYALATKTINKNNIKIQLAYDYSHDQHMLSSLSYDLLLMTFAALVIAVALSTLIIKLGLKPFNKLIEQIAKIDPTQLKQRLSEEHVNHITELKPFVHTLNQAIERIDQGMEQLANFSAHAAHELRTPLNNLMISNEILLNNNEIPPKSQEIIESNIEECRRLSRTIDRFLLLARLDTHKMPLQLENLELRNEAEFICSYYEALAEDKKIQFQITGSGTLVADATLFRQALSNLISNAIKFSPNNSCISIYFHATINHIKINVADHGPGIAKVHWPKITKPFYRVNDESAPGMGLGLAIVQAILTAHHGHLEITENTSTGTIMTLVFPK
ncbi:heavy metal sensor histidine kinase [Piscirickettsia litoralis]|uniref:Sensor protein n=1 Tax=Piscirickettsia litoralis TaxID=1891921 RepID=A0ABX3A147_9GAMM|nr:heavy metal sensor histidine kinase [Piscirickettsia litoralis]ODN42354.1 hypothetical protein BGC07_04670 [Piscirickettsia litoralis]